MPLPQINPMRRHERATLSYSYAGECGRGAFISLCRDFALLVAVSHFGVTDRWWLWLLSSASFFGMLLASNSAALATRWRKKSLIRTAEVISRSLAIAAACAWGGRGFVAFMALAIAAATMSVPLLSGIYAGNFGTLIRGRAVGRLQAVAVGTTALSGVLLGAVMDVNTGYFRGLLIGVSMFSMACSWYAWRLPETRRVTNRPQPRAGLREVLAVLLRDRAFLYVECIWFIMGLSNLWLFPIRVLHLTEIGFSEQQVMLATTVTMYAVMVLGVGMWGRILYRINFAAYRIATLVFFIAGIAVFFSGRSVVVVLAGSALWGLGLAGGGLSWRLVATFFTTPERLPVYMAAHTFLCGVRGIVGPFLSLRLRETHSTQFIVSLSLMGMASCVLLLLPLAPVMSRRRRQIDADVARPDPSSVPPGY